ncbi:MAG: DUF1016 domain-containing protein [Chlorobaculum sp.]|nr:DUF1016 domain-containing protein [Chlorobaculum sp.]
MPILVNPGISDSRIVATASPQSEINPPVGILLCTDKSRALVEYALAGMDNQLFVSKYQLELSDKEQMQWFIDEQLREVGG